MLVDLRFEIRDSRQRISFCVVCVKKKKRRRVGQCVVRPPDLIKLNQFLGKFRAALAARNVIRSDITLLVTPTAKVWENRGAALKIAYIVPPIGYVVCVANLVAEGYRILMPKSDNFSLKVKQSITTPSSGTTTAALFHAWTG